MEDEIKRLKEEVEYYKNSAKMMENLVSLQRDTIVKQHKIFMLNQAEIQKLKEQIPSE